MKRQARIRRHKRIRKYLKGNSLCPRLAVFRSTQHIYAQVIDDGLGKTLFSLSDKEMKGTKLEKAYQVGKEVSVKCLKGKIKKVVFDRGGFLYHGRIAELAKGAREGGLEF